MEFYLVQKTGFLHTTREEEEEAKNRFGFLFLLFLSIIIELTCYELFKIRPINRGV